MRPQLTRSTAHIRYKAFAKAYMGKALRNATQAAIIAGYSPHTAAQTGYDLLRTGEVRRLLRIEAERQARKMEVGPQEVIAELGKLAFANMQDFVDDTGKFVGMDALSRDGAAAVSELTIDEERRTDGRSGSKRKPGKTATTVTRTRIKLSNKREALELLGKHWNLFGDRDGGSQTAVKVIVVNSPRPINAIDAEREVDAIEALPASDGGTGRALPTPTDGPSPAIATDEPWGEGGPDVL